MWRAHDDNNGVDDNDDDDDDDDNDDDDDAPWGNLGDRIIIFGFSQAQFCSRASKNQFPDSSRQLLSDARHI